MFLGFLRIHSGKGFLQVYDSTCIVITNLRLHYVPASLFVWLNYNLEIFNA